MPVLSVLLAVVHVLAVIPGAAEDATAGNHQEKWVQVGGGLFLAVSLQAPGGPQVAALRVFSHGHWAVDGRLGRAGVRSSLGGLSASPDGRVHAVWVDYAGPGHVWYAERGPWGWSPGRQLSPGPRYAGFPSVAAGVAGVHVLWYAVRPSELTRHGAAYEVVHTWRSQGGWSAPQVVSWGLPDALNPSAAAVAESVHAAWYQWDQDRYRVQHARWHRGRWHPSEPISPPDEDASGVSLEGAEDGGLHAVWVARTRAGPVVLYRRRSANGRWGPIDRLGPGDHPVVAESQRSVFVAWSHGGRIRLRVGREGRWGPLVDLGTGEHPALSSTSPVYVAYTRRTPTGWEVVVSMVSASRDGRWGAGWWLPLAAGVAYLLWRVRRAAVRRAAIHGGEPA
ncbi:MAG: hypothetical protein RMM30_03385 [Armatimonadota bacterium]|nr:hypothetical protein [Armatimonadota bacterium]MDW8155612.1 hypothetical protein [Armatimonadota bacterium]